MRRLLVTGAIALAACTSTGSRPAADAAGDPDSSGERLYRAHCAACHRLRDPAKRTRQAWAEAVERYGPRAHLSPEERRLVLGYLQAHAADAAGPAR